MSGSAPRGSARKNAAGRDNADGPRDESRAARPSTARREPVENELYEHVTQLFAERGCADTSLQDIADALGTTWLAKRYDLSPPTG